jgi:hydroxyacylglutathione hydrolase
MIQFENFQFNPFQENSWVIWNEAKDCIILDPGCSNMAEEKQLKEFIAENGLKPTAVWLTHCHIDHVLGLEFCLKTWQIPYFLHPLEKAALKSVEVYAPAYGFAHFRAPDADGIEIQEGEIQLGEETFRILFVPGHSPGHLAFYHQASAQVWAGDVLFRGSIGRTDLPGGDFNTLALSIRNSLYSLPKETLVYTGHGTETSIGHEMNFNPFVTA